LANLVCEFLFANNWFDPDQASEQFAGTKVLLLNVIKHVKPLRKRGDFQSAEIAQFA